MSENDPLKLTATGTKSYYLKREGTQSRLKVRRCVSHILGGLLSTPVILIMVLLLYASQTVLDIEKDVRGTFPRLSVNDSRHVSFAEMSLEAAINERPTLTDTSQMTEKTSFKASIAQEKVRYVVYDAFYGQLGNQLISLVNAMVVADELDATLVLPYAAIRWGRTPGPVTVSEYQIGNETVRGADVTHSLIGSYYDYLRGSPKLTSEEKFMQTNSYRRLKTMNMSVPSESKYFHKMLNLDQGVGTNDGRNLCQRDKKANIPQLWCRKTNRSGSYGTDVLILPPMFSQRNGSLDDPRWNAVRSALRPRKDFVNLAEQFWKRVEKPVLGIHLRGLEDVDHEVIPKHFLDVLEGELGSALSQAKSVYVAAAPQTFTKLQSAIAKYVRTKGKLFLSLQDMLKFDVNGKFGPGTSDRLPYAHPTLDILALSKSNFLVGRERSSLLREASRLRSYARKPLGPATFVLTKHAYRGPYKPDNFTYSSASID